MMITLKTYKRKIVYFEVFYFFKTTRLKHNNENLTNYNIHMDARVQNIINISAARHNLFVSQNK